MRTDVIEKIKEEDKVMMCDLTTSLMMGNTSRMELDIASPI
jgi:hypothetical protein